jgi:hypothetical protein
MSWKSTAIDWPDEDEKEAAKEWVDSQSCPAWRDGYVMVDGTCIPLADRPGRHGNSYFDRKKNYSLNVQVWQNCIYVSLRTAH